MKTVIEGKKYQLAGLGTSYTCIKVDKKGATLIGDKGSKLVVPKNKFNILK